MRQRGRDVAVYDAKDIPRFRAEGDGYPTHNRLHEALEPGGLIIGCTGKPVLDRSDHRRIPDGSILVSASSADVEFRAW
jgi:S-adenosylhomocysteine hydrolase